MLQHYQTLIKQQVLCHDKAQLTAVTALAKLSSTLEKSTVTKKNGPKSLKPIFQFIQSSEQPIQGIYLHGRVGRGKTMLMDLFYQHTQIKCKKRIHFHRFMEEVHAQMNELSLTTSADNPLTIIANQWAHNIELLCFDEFYVTDIGDAIILARLFEQLFVCGVVLVATSNCQPEQLYRNGLLRERFLPTIDLINQYCQVLSVDGEIDHRLTHHNPEHCPYYFLSQANGVAKLTQVFQHYTQDHLICSGSLAVNHRTIKYLGKSEDIIWFDFFDLCAGPRSQRDYIYIADNFKSVLISAVPQFSGKLIPAVFSGIEDRYQRSGVLMGNLRYLDDEARRFIALVDEFYDRNVSLVISADVAIDELYQGEQLAFEFQRCQSRLFEMQQNNFK